MEIRIENIEQIRTAARDFIELVFHNSQAQGLPSPTVIAFYGQMGSGKTTFIKALCEELGVEDVITSPTFAIVNEYSLSSNFNIYHFDFYRIKRLEEVYDMGYEDYFYRPDALCLVEWPELIEGLLPADALKVQIKEHDGGERTVLF